MVGEQDLRPGPADEGRKVRGRVEKATNEGLRFPVSMSHLLVMEMIISD